MNTKIYEFNSVVKNIKNVVREARHMSCIISNENVKNEFIKLCYFIDDVNFKVSFVNETEDYLHENMLDTMDYIKFTLMENEQNPNVLSVYNSIYDIIREWYFND